MRAPSPLVKTRQTLGVRRALVKAVKSPSKRGPGSGPYYPPLDGELASELERANTSAASPRAGGVTGVDVLFGWRIIIFFLQAASRNCR